MKIAVGIVLFIRDVRIEIVVRGTENQARSSQNPAVSAQVAAEYGERISLFPQHPGCERIFPCRHPVIRRIGFIGHFSEEFAVQPDPGEIVDDAEARTELKRFLRAEGKDDGTSGLRNLASTARLDLILEQNARMAAAVGQYQAGMDPDILERFPCWRYIGSTALNPRDSHARFAGKVFRKDDPIWHKIFPPSDFNCKCSVEDCDDEPDRVPKTIEPPESGFAFDPAHAFEEFDLSSIRNEELRKKTEEGIQRILSENKTSGQLQNGEKRKAQWQTAYQNRLERWEKETRKTGLKSEAVELLLECYTPEAAKFGKPPRIVANPGGKTYLTQDGTILYIGPDAKSPEDVIKKIGNLSHKLKRGKQYRIAKANRLKRVHQLPIDKALQATEEKNLAIFGKEYLRAEKEIQKRVDRIREKLQEQLDKKNGVGYWAAFNRVNQRQTRLKQIQEDMMIRLAAETLGKEIPVKAVIRTSAASNVANVTQQIKGVLEKCVSGDIVTQDMVLSVVKVPRATKNERAFYSPTTKKLNLNTHPKISGKLSTGIHESMHWLEDFNPHVHKRCVEFLEHRCKGETPQSLRRLTGLGYRSYEMTRPDNFFRPYCGKDYIDANGNRYATEVLSMGVEQMLKGPAAFAKQDPEYFNFVVSVLKGEI